ncbi:MAG: ribose-phosphate pyrophosphokinase [Bacillota bacterium]|nr:ribose-phosphate pyrophosphokinase [Bacillota bacterium]
MKHSRYSTYKVFAGNSNKALAEEIAAILGKPLGRADVTTFSDGEISISLGETVRGIDAYIIQSTCDPVNRSLMELLIMIDAMKRASAGRINAVVPYYGYARQDRKAKARDPITAKLVADLITAAGADRVITMDLHANQIQGFFNIPVDHLIGIPILVKYFIEKRLEDVVVVSPDHGSVVRARNMATPMNVPIAIIDKRRPKPNVAEVMNIIGEIKDKTAIIVDDMIDTAGTITLAAEALMKMGAKEVYAAATHPVLSGPAIKRIEESCIREMVLLNTVPMPPEKRIDKIHTLSVAPLFAEAVLRVHTDDSLSRIFD